MEKLLLRVEEAADQLGVGRTLLYAKVLSGEIESVKVNRARRIPVSSLAAYVEKLREEAPSELSGSR